MPNSEIKQTVIVLDDDKGQLESMERSLRLFFNVVSYDKPLEALNSEHLGHAVVIISDLKMPEMTGIEFLTQASKKSPHASCILVTAHVETESVIKAFNEAKIFRFISKPWSPAELLQAVQIAAEQCKLKCENQRLVSELQIKNSELNTLNGSLETQVKSRTQELEVANVQLQELAVTDSLTKVYNRRGFFTRFVEEIDRSQRYRHPIVVAMIDVDMFKHFNDTEGHVCGDEALKRIAQILQRNLRKTDVLGRYGGEEFIIMMPETSMDTGGKEICERLRLGVDGHKFQGKTQHAYLTISVGIACFPGDGQSTDELVAVADAALYEAKAHGRNKVLYQKNHGTFFIS